MTVVSGQQTAVTGMKIGFAGMLADSTMVKHADSKYSAETSATIPFGTGVVRHSSDEDNAVVKPHTSAAAAVPLFAGIVLHDHTLVPEIELDSDGAIKPKVTMSVLQKGRVYVVPEDAVDPGDAVRMRVVVAGSEVAGAFRAAADGTDCINLSAIARWVTSGSSTVPAVLEIDMTGVSAITADT